MISFGFAFVGRLRVQPTFKNGMRPVHPGEVLREDFLKPLGMSVNASSWLNLQTAYDLRVADISSAKKIAREISPATP
jgi:antitoxin HigA-1